MIGKTKLLYTEKQIGFMTLKKFIMLYKAYKSNFDLEMLMKRKGITYEKLEYEPDIDDAIPF